jgi:hypothetical protein
MELFKDTDDELLDELLDEHDLSVFIKLSTLIEGKSGK